MHTHPYGVLPLGNVFTDSHAEHMQARQKGLGSLSWLSDALIIRILETILSTFAPKEAAICLTNFSAASTYTFAFASDDDLWRSLTFRLFNVAQVARAPFDISWRRTFLALHGITKQNKQESLIVNQKGTHVYSDVLFHKWRCLTAQIKPEWLANSNVSRISYDEASVENFRAKFENTNFPVIVTGCVPKWQAFSTWSKALLSDRFGDVEFYAGGFNFRIKDYFSYCEAVEGYDDQPLYIFDKDFASKAPLMAEDYEIPKYFSEDLFKVLESHRPDYRWLIIGPARSGSSFHKDPNSTSAWNAVIRGRKKWVMFPPEVTPPGVYPSGDGGDVTAPVSVSEWFINFYDRNRLQALGARECIVEEGELIFVPMGWWHCVLNLETSIAITQNYVGSCNFSSVLRWIQSRPHQISGCRSREDAKFLRENFAPLVLSQYPLLRHRMDEERTESRLATQARGKGKRSLWDTLRTSNGVTQNISEVFGKNPKHPQTGSRRESFAFGF